ncbi:pepsinogen c precursor [Stylonychia lemnae]|uniref:Pepsinogen c n=1 Tax=Stylonychia lemnae TaxID=5949 RepID=A0A078AFY4_STYLE|nr:pepsinogen c precursor [Stylonychia lemnae]|eukprot:CDW80761.1 pepsinogen c precursor [Stylonychia lemnae]
MGTSAKKVSLLFDTAQDWLSVESAGCRTCAGSNYNIGSSSNYKQASNRASYHFYGTSGWLGYNSTDEVYLDSTKSIGISDFLWFLVIDQQGIGKISNYMVSMNLGNQDSQSFVQIGGYSNSQMRDPSKLIWIESTLDFYWTVTINGFKTTKGALYANQLLSVYTSSRFKGIIDSGQPLIYLPKSNSLGKVYAYYENLFMVSCETSGFDPISVLINGNWFEISPETYIVEVKESPQICALGFQINGDDAFILGNVFLRNYYTIFDYQNNRIGFSPQKLSYISDISLYENYSGIGFMIFTEEFFYICGWIINIVFFIALFYGLLYLLQWINNKQ